jgi:hypothetical protein
VEYNGLVVEITGITRAESPRYIVPGRNIRLKPEHIRCLVPICFDEVLSLTAPLPTSFSYWKSGCFGRIGFLDYVRCEKSRVTLISIAPSEYLLSWAALNAVRRVCQEVTERYLSDGAELKEYFGALLTGKCSPPMWGCGELTAHTSMLLLQRGITQFLVVSAVCYDGTAALSSKTHAFLVVFRHTSSRAFYRGDEFDLQSALEQGAIVMDPLLQLIFSREEQDKVSFFMEALDAYSPPSNRMLRTIDMSEILKTYGSVERIRTTIDAKVNQLFELKKKCELSEHLSSARE